MRKHVHVSKHAVIFESTILPHHAHKNSSCQFLRSHMCRTCLLLDSKASDMLAAMSVDVSNQGAIFFRAWIHSTAPRNLARRYPRSGAHGKQVKMSYERFFITESPCVHAVPQRIDKYSEFTHKAYKRVCLQNIQPSRKMLTYKSCRKSVCKKHTA